MTEHRRQSKGKSDGRLWRVIGVSVISTGLLIGLSIWSANRQAPVTDMKTDAELGAVRTVRGSATAKVTVVEYGDYL